MRRLRRLTLSELRGEAFVLKDDEVKKLRGRGYWHWTPDTGWTYMLDEVTVFGSSICDSSAYSPYGDSYSGSSSGAWYGNFLGPGPDADPASLGLLPINQLDSACFQHDVQYYLNDTGGILGALFNVQVDYADAQLACDAFKAAINNNNDLRQRLIAGGVGVLFGLIAAYKYEFSYPGL